jgi:phenylalanyl-tRNA synthetase beta subunit
MLYTKNIPTRDKDPLLSAKNIVKTLLKEIGINSDVSREKNDSIHYHPKKQANIELKTTD